MISQKDIHLPARCLECGSVVIDEVNHRCPEPVAYSIVLEEKN